MAYVSSHALIASVFCFLIPFSSRIWFAWRLFSVALLNAYYAPQKCSLFFFFLVLLSSVTLEADWKGANHGSANSLVSCPVSVLLYVRRVCDVCLCARVFFCHIFFFCLFCIEFITVQHLCQHPARWFAAECHKVAILLLFFPPFISCPRYCWGEGVVNDSRGSYPTLWELKAICFPVWTLCKECFPSAKRV